MDVSLLVTSTSLFLNNLITVNVVTSTLLYSAKATCTFCYLAKATCTFCYLAKVLVNALFFCMFYFVFLSYTSRVPAASRYSGRRYSRYWRVPHPPLHDREGVNFFIGGSYLSSFHCMGLAIRRKKFCLLNENLHNTWEIQLILMVIDFEILQSK